MQTITISVPDSFTADQISFIKRSALNQVETEMLKSVQVPKEMTDAIDAVKIEVDQVLEASDEPKKYESISISAEPTEVTLGSIGMKVI